MNDPIRYVIVVHGMGMAKPNETVLGVVSRFADARSGRDWPPPPDITTLGAATGQVGRTIATADVPWLEFAGIPRVKPPAGATPDRPFLGQLARPADGANVRFLDVHWKDLMTEDFPDVGQSPDVWLDGLLGRLRRKHAAALTGHDPTQPPPPAAVPQWALEVLGALRETVRLVHGVMSLKAASLDQTVFNDYLGDVQLYGEYAYTRGRAVRRFHDLMTHLDDRHRAIEGDRPAEYTVIAHSLGTVMAMDALVYAHARADVRRAANASAAPNLPLHGYLTEPEAALLRQGAAPADPADQAARQRLERLTAADWVDRVDAFVTLGSPIDKFLVIWWLNYQHLRVTTWLDPARLRAPDRRIRHFNYCEAQDPVGDNLDVARTAPAFDAVFHNVEDKVYTRYAVPGAAHVKYWHDVDLFKRIVDRTVDEPQRPALAPAADPRPVQWFDAGVFLWILTISYWVVPTAAIVVNTVTFFFAYNAERWFGSITPALALFGVWLFARYLIDLLIWWRQIMRAKDPIEVGAPVPGTVTAPLGADVIPAALRAKLVCDPHARTLHAHNLDPAADGPGIAAIADVALRAAAAALADKSQVLRDDAAVSPGRDVRRFVRWAAGRAPAQTPPGDVAPADRDEANQRFQNAREAAFRGSLTVAYALLLVAAGLLAGLYLHRVVVPARWACYASPCADASRWPLNVGRLLVTLGVFALGWVGWHWLTSDKASATRHERLGRDFQDQREDEYLFGRNDAATFGRLAFAIVVGTLVAFLVPRGWLSKPSPVFGLAALAAMAALHLDYVRTRLNRIRRILRADRFRTVDFQQYAADAPPPGTPGAAPAA